MFYDVLRKGVLLCRVIYWARHCDDITTVDAGGVKEIPDKFIVLKASHHVEYFTATRADVDRAKGS